jgi:hypothetical protein
MSTPTERNNMIATLYTTIGDKNYIDTFDSHEAAQQAFAATVLRAETSTEIRGAVLDLGGANVTHWSRDDGEETGAWSRSFAVQNGRAKPTTPTAKEILQHHVQRLVAAGEPTFVEIPANPERGDSGAV